MFISLALIFLVGICLGGILKTLKIPSLIGMLITGMVLGPYALDLIDDSLLNISRELRQIALIVILMRAGLSLDINDLKKVGRPAILMCFIPACFEIGAMMLFAPKLLGMTLLEAAMLGSVIAAVSPAVIVPRMLQLMDEGYGVNKSIPQLILAGASVDDIFVIVIFSSLTSLTVGGQFSWEKVAQIPIAIVFGVIVGGVCGWLLTQLFKKIHMRDTIKLIVILSFAFLLVALENQIGESIPFSGLLAVMAIGIALLKFYPQVAQRISPKFSKVWVIAEIVLFVLVGATVDIQYAVLAGTQVLILLTIVVLVRMIGVYVCLYKTSLDSKEKLFCMIAYIPKATVQAAIGSIPLEMGLPQGQMILAVSCVAILLTAPIGALGIDFTYPSLLKKENEKN